MITLFKPRGPYGLLFLIRGASLLVAVTVLAFGWARLDRTPPLHLSTSYALESAAAGPVPEISLASVESVRLRPGQPMVQALVEAGVRPEDSGAAVAGLVRLVDLRRVRPADTFTLYRSRAGELRRVEYERSGGLERVILEPADRGFDGHVVAKPVENYLRKIEGTVEDNLFFSVLRAGGDAGLVSSFADLFSWDFDFFTETRSGDRFELLVEQRVIEGEREASGRIVAARYLPVGSAHALDAFRYAWEGGETAYYTGDGRSVKKAFLKSPLNYRRISSHFTTRRFHPIHKRYRPHLGIDYAAPTGTPVVALGGGRVTLVGWRNGFGKTVAIRHNGNVVTQYAHLSRYAQGIHAGDRVKQGELIGYVGQTGHATGPHLDFRVQMAGRWINPLDLKGGQAEPLPKKLQEDFAETVRRSEDLFHALSPGDMVRLEGDTHEIPQLAQARLDTSSTS